MAFIPVVIATSINLWGLNNFCLMCYSTVCFDISYCLSMEPRLLPSSYTVGLVVMSESLGVPRVKLSGL